MRANEMIALFRRMAAERWRYEWGAAREGCVDCSGAFVWAGKQGGLRLPHGSNAIARRCVQALLPIAEAAPGMAVFRRRSPGAKGWALPAGYAGAKDRNDYYHIGLVDADGQHVLHAASARTGFVRGTLSGWHCCGRLSLLVYAAEGYTVAVPAGETLNVRAAPSKQSARLTRLPAGTAVEADTAADGWVHLTAPVIGWVMAEFLHKEEES